MRRNLVCMALDEVCVFVEFGAEPLPHSRRLRTQTITARPTYTDFFAWLNEVAAPDDTSIIANADIFFDESLRVVAKWQPRRRTALALARWNLQDDGSAALFDRNDSQDAWVFKGTVSGVFGDFPVGVPRCDNRLVHELEKGGYIVRNPAFTIRTYHLHSGERVEYGTLNENDFVGPPYGYVWPGNLWPLGLTLWHRMLSPANTLSWRLDRRLWSARLRFRHLSRGVETLATLLRRRNV